LSPYEQRRIAEDTGFTFAGYDLYLTAERQLDAATDATGYLPAIELFRQAVRRDDRFALGWAGLSLANWVRATRRGIVESMDDAEYAARRALELDPGLPEGHLALARVLRETGRREEAQSELEKAMAAHSQPDHIQRQLAEDLERVGDREGAEAALRAATAIAPSEWRNHNALGRLLWRQGNNEAALSTFRTAAGLVPAGINGPRVSVVAVLIQLGQFEAAIEASKEIPGPITDAVLASNLGTACYFVGDLKKAQEYYRMAVELRPRHVGVRRNLGDALEALGQDDEARNQYAEAQRLAEEQLAQDPDDVELAVLAAFLAAKSGDCVAATCRADEVVHVAPDSTDIVHQAAYVDALCGRREIALERIERALNLGASAELIRIEPEFESLANDPEFQALVGRPR
jgi:tetratricopeptide (TPR) repeat protein